MAVKWITGGSVPAVAVIRQTEISWELPPGQK